MVSTGYFVLKASELLQEVNELVTELTTLVGNDLFRTPMPENHFVEEIGNMPGFRGWYGLSFRPF